MSGSVLVTLAADPEGLRARPLKRRPVAHIGALPTQLWFLSASTNSPIVKPPFELPLKIVQSLGEVTFEGSEG